MVSGGRGGQPGLVPRRSLAYSGDMVLGSVHRKVLTAFGVVGYVIQHPANRQQRARALFRATAFQIRGRLGHRTLTGVGDTQRMWAILHHAASSKALYANPPDWPEMQAWRRILKAGDLFVDVGSNVGVYTLWALDLGAQVIAVEPSTDSVGLLRDNLALNGQPEVAVLECALAAKTGSMMLTRGRDTENRLLVGEGTGQRVHVETLDNVLQGRTAAGVKIDVEGAERLVMEGARVSLAEGRIKVLQIEWNHMSKSMLDEGREPVAAILKLHKYDLFRPNDQGELVPIQDVSFGADVFAVLRESL